MPSFARTASSRVIILTKAWRLSVLTMHVWTLPNAKKIARKSSSEDLRTVNTLFVDNEGSYLRDPTDKQCSTQYCRLVS